MKSRADMALPDAGGRRPRWRRPTEVRGRRLSLPGRAAGMHGAAVGCISGDGAGRVAGDGEGTWRGAGGNSGSATVEARPHRRAGQPRGHGQASGAEWVSDRRRSGGRSGAPKDWVGLQRAGQGHGGASSKKNGSVLHGEEESYDENKIEPIAYFPLTGGSGGNFFLTPPNLILWSTPCAPPIPWIWGFSWSKYVVELLDLKPFS